MSVHADFCSRHVGVFGEVRDAMLKEVGYERVVDLIDDAVPGAIRLQQPMELPDALSENAALDRLKSILSENEVKRSLIGQGYNGTLTPAVIQRNILENPGWYTAYTPYQAEISQGRLEALMNFQTMVADLTGLDVSNSSLLDEATAAAEAVTLALTKSRKGTTVFVSDSCHPQTIAVVRTRTEAVGLKLVVGDWKTFDPAACDGFFNAIVQYPDTTGTIEDYAAFAEAVHAVKGATLTVCADILALTVLREPAAFGADICVGSSQRFGVPMGYGGPHAAFLACKDEFKRKMPGRIIGMSYDPQGKPGYRLALQTREQHIRRDKATSNICTAQVLLAVMASMYAVYHGPDGLQHIAKEIHYRTQVVANQLSGAGFEVTEKDYFDTITVKAAGRAEELVAKAEAANFNLRLLNADELCISLDETVNNQEVADLLAVFGVEVTAQLVAAEVETGEVAWDATHERQSEFLTQKVFNSYRSETEMMRYIRRLEGKDLALNHSMIALGSCTMKLNAASEMMPVSWPEIGQMHPFAPASQSKGYVKMLKELEDWLSEITGFAAVSLQPNAGSQGEYAGLLAIRAYHRSRGDDNRDVCLIPTSAHGTNPASAVMCGMKVVGVRCDDEGNIDVADLKAKAEEHSENLAALMVTYPSTHGVYEASIIDICDTIHAHGGQVYMDGANMNAQVGLTSPGKIGADVCHLNLHKTFCIPHGGGGPGVGPIGVAPQLVPFLPGHEAMLERKEGAVSSAPYGSASINVIPWMYIQMMGEPGLTEATKIAILNANYMAGRLNEHFPILYTGNKGLIAHECIIDVRPLSDQTGISVEDVAKRLMDYGFHAPTMSFPVGGTLMIEPTESESREEMDRFCDALISIKGEMIEVLEGKADPENNVLKHAPHTIEVICGNDWDRPYSREKAAFPLPYVKANKFWPSVGRVDNVAGDRNLICTCDTVANYEAATADM
mgnify:CR=1 FL=1